jgi:regulator of cell morphogenesis and NO signaling
MNELSTQTLAQIVKNNYRTAAIFEKYHLDFCCKGKRTLESACAEQQLPIKEIVSELETIFTNQNNVHSDFDSMTLTGLCNYIMETHHSYVKKELPQIYFYLQKVASKHGERHPELHKIFELFARVKEEMESHMQKEELVLFPRIKELEKLISQQPASQKLNIAYLQSPITVMEQEHDFAGSTMEEIRHLTNNYTPPPDACTTYRLSFESLKAFEEDLHRHVHLENNILFPKSISTFMELQDSVLN